MLDQKQGLLSGQVPRTDAELCLLNDPCDLLLQPLRHFLAVPADDASEVVICARLQLHALLLSPLVLPLSVRIWSDPRFLFATPIISGARFLSTEILINRVLL